MGLFSGLQKVYAVGVTSAANILTKGIGAVTGKTYGTTTSKEFLSTKTGQVLSGAAVITAGTLGGVLAGQAVTAAGGVKVVAAKAITAAAPGVAKFAGTVLKSPFKAVAVAGVVAGGGLKLVPKLFQTTKTAAEKAVPVLLGEEKLTSETAVSTAKIVGLALGLGVVGAGAGMVLEKVLEKKEEQELILTPATMPPVLESALLPEKSVGTAETPILPETTTITTGKKPYKRRRATKIQAVRQSVKININNRATGTKYINKRNYY